MAERLIPGTAPIPPALPQAGDMVSVGLTRPIEAVVCRHSHKNMTTVKPAIEVVYLNGAGQACNEQACWTGSHWAFISGNTPSNPVGSNAYSRLRPYLALLRLRGRGSF